MPPGWELEIVVSEVHELPLPPVPAVLPPVPAVLPPAPSSAFAQRRAERALRKAPPPPPPRSLQPSVPAVMVDGQVVADFPGAPTDVGSMNSRALHYCRGELVLLSGDDDLQSPDRLAASIHAYKEGAVMMGYKNFRFVDLHTGAVALWEGPEHCAGSTMAYKRSLLVGAGGWGGRCHNGADRRLHENLRSIGFQEERIVGISAQLGAESAFLAHGKNISGKHYFGEVRRKIGSFFIHRIARHYSELSWLPHIREHLDKLTAHV